MESSLHLSEENQNEDGSSPVTSLAKKKATPNPKEGLEVVRFLRKFGVGELKAKYKIITHYHSRHPHLVQFKYSQMNSPMGSQIVQECRGIILNEKKDWDVVALPYFKFFNYGESYAPELDWSTVTVHEKIDGSLATLYWYSFKLKRSREVRREVGSGLLLPPRCLGPFGTFNYICGTLLVSPLIPLTKRDIWKKLNYSFPKNTTYCYMFEMLTPRNIILVRPTREQLLLHGVRDMTTLEELEPLPVAQMNGWESLSPLPLKSLHEIVAKAKTLNPMTHGTHSFQGFVVRDSQWNRVKIKSPQYVAISHLSLNDKGKLNMRSMIQIVRINESEEFLSYFPSYRKLFEMVKFKYNQLANRIQRYWEETSAAKTQKEFLEITEELSVEGKYRSLLTKMREGKYTDARTFLMEYNLNELFLMVKEELSVDQMNSTYKYWEDEALAISKKKKNKKKKNESSIVVEPAYEIDDVSLVGVDSGTASSKSHSSAKKKTTKDTKENVQSRRGRRGEQQEVDLLANLLKLNQMAEEQEGPTQEEDKEEDLWDEPSKKSKKKGKKGKRK